MTDNFNEYFEKGIFFLIKSGNNELRIFEEDKAIIVRIYSFTQIQHERRFDKPFWQKKRSWQTFSEDVAPNGFEPEDMKTKIIEMYNMFVDWKDGQTVSEAYEPQVVTTSKVDSATLYEEIVTDNKAMFIYLNSSKFKRSESVNVNGVTYIPILDDAIKQQAVLLPSDAIEYGSVEKLIDDIQKHIRTYLDIDDDYVVFASYYTLLSWVYEKIDTLPYLRALGDTGTGKSRFLRILGGLCYKPIFVAGAITPAPIYRMIKRWGGTLVVDEADFKDSDEKGEVITILNCGFSKGMPVIRCERDNPDNVQILPTFSPKIIATRKSFTDAALESRCLTQIMRQTIRRNIPRILPKEFYEEELLLRNKLLKFRFDHYDKVDTNKIKDIKLGELEPRLEQATISFAVLFYNIPEVFEKFKAFLKEYQQGLIEERASSYDGQIVTAYIELVDNGIKDISAVDIAAHIDEPKVFSARVIGKHLKSLGLITKINKSLKKRPIIFNEEQYKTLKARYNSEYYTEIINKNIYKDTSETSETSVLGDCHIILNNISLDIDKEIEIISTHPPLSHTHVSDVAHVTETRRCDGCGKIKLIKVSKKEIDTVTGKLETFYYCDECSNGQVG